jgi:hypothetical protein
VLDRHTQGVLKSRTSLSRILVQPTVVVNSWSPAVKLKEDRDRYRHYRVSEIRLRIRQKVPADAVHLLINDSEIDICYERV